MSSATHSFSMTEDVPRFQRYPLYKKGTDTITDFLIKASGYVPPPANDGESTSTYTLPNTREYLRLTRIIVQSGPPPIKVPAHLFKVFSDVINLRKLHTARFMISPTRDEETQRRNKSHIFFTEILSQVKDDLQNHANREHCSPNPATTIDSLSIPTPGKAVEMQLRQMSMSSAEEPVEATLVQWKTPYLSRPRKKSHWTQSMNSSSQLSCCSRISWTSVIIFARSGKSIKSV